MLKSGLFACALGATLALCSGAEAGRYVGDADLVLNARPYPANRVSGPEQTPAGRLWVPSYPVGTRTPIIEHVPFAEGPRSYGAPYEAWDETVYVRVNHTPIAISPWREYHEDGLQRLRQARHTWLRQHGYIQSVRTHVNPRYLYEADERSEAEPRAIIHIRERHRMPDGPVQADATPPRVIRVIRPEEETGVASAEPDTE